MQVPLIFPSKAIGSKWSIKQHLPLNLNKSKHIKIERARQMTANEIIYLLESALNNCNTITIQCNVSLYTDSVYELTGTLFQTKEQQLVLYDRLTHLPTIIWPTSIRHITILK